MNFVQITMDLNQSVMKVDKNFEFAFIGDSFYGRNAYRI